MDPFSRSTKLPGQQKYSNWISASTFCPTILSFHYRNQRKTWQHPTSSDLSSQRMQLIWIWAMTAPLGFSRFCVCFVILLFISLIISHDCVVYQIYIYSCIILFIHSKTQKLVCWLTLDVVIIVDWWLQFCYRQPTTHINHLFFKMPPRYSDS